MTYLKDRCTIRNSVTQYTNSQLYGQSSLKHPSQLSLQSQIQEKVLFLHIHLYSISKIQNNVLTTETIYDLLDIS